MTWLDRLRYEKSELDDRIAKLDKFRRSDEFLKLDMESRVLLSIQASTMDTYSKILDARYWKARSELNVEKPKPPTKSQTEQEILNRAVHQVEMAFSQFRLDDQDEWPAIEALRQLSQDSARLLAMVPKLIELNEQSRKRIQELELIERLNDERSQRS